MVRKGRGARHRRRKKKRVQRTSAKKRPAGRQANLQSALDKRSAEPGSKSLYLGVAVVIAVLAAGALYLFKERTEPFPRNVWTREYTIPPRELPLGDVEEALRKVPEGSDEWDTEELDVEIESRLEKLAVALEDMPDFDSFPPGLLSPEFKGTPLEPATARKVKDEEGLEIFRGDPDSEERVTAAAFPSEIAKLLREAVRVEDVKFKVTRIESPRLPGSAVVSDVIYTILGQGKDGEILQWKGDWQLGWRKDPAGRWKLSRLRVLDTSRARSVRDAFTEVTHQALGKNDSYRKQLLQGVEYWQGILDYVAGMDIYGHNGVAIADIDGDGDEDFHVSQPAGLPNLLFRNEGDGTFLDVTEKAGVDVLDNTASSFFADTDNDGDPDLILIGTSSLLFENDGSGRFSPASDSGFEAIDGTDGSKVSAAVADYDLDGHLDIYVCSYAFWQGQEELGNYPFPYHDANNGAPNVLLRNQGDGSFRDVTRQSGMNRNNLRYSFAAAWGDYNGDRYPDLYVANDFGRNNLYRNNGDGTFTDVAREAGVEDIGAGMSAAWEDFDNDGRLDLYVGNMWSSAGQRITSLRQFQTQRPDEEVQSYRRHAKGNSLFSNRGDGTFEEVGAEADVELGRWAWSSDFFDFDNDGHEDLYVVNGFITNEDTKDL